MCIVFGLLLSIVIMSIIVLFSFLRCIIIFPVSLFMFLCFLYVDFVCFCDWCWFVLFLCFPFFGGVFVLLLKIGAAFLVGFYLFF